MKPDLAKKILLGVFSASFASTFFVPLPVCAAADQQTVNKDATKAAENENAHELGDTVVEGARRGYADGRVSGRGGVGLLGKQDVMDASFNAVTLGHKSFEDFSLPGQALTNVLTLDPSVRSSTSNLYNDISIRGFNASGHFYYVNGIPAMFFQGNIPTLFAESVTVVAGPGSGTNSTSFRDNAGGTVDITSKQAQTKPNLDMKLTFSGRSSLEESIDFGKRFGANNEMGLRINANNISGGTSTQGEKLKQENIFVNLDQKSSHSKTNLLLGYTHTKHTAGMWSITFQDAVTSLPSAIDGSRNLKPNWAYNEYDSIFAALNHEEKLSDHAKLFINAAWHHLNWYGYVDGTVKVGNNLGDYTIGFSNYPIETYNRYLGIGIRGDFKLGEVKNDYVLSFDRISQANYGGQKPGFSPGVTGNIYRGIATQTYTGTPDFVAPHGSDTALRGWHVIDTLTSPNKKLIVTLGLHGHSATVDSYNKTTGKITSSVNSDATCPTFGVTYKFTPHLMAYANHAESFSTGSLVGSSYVNAGEVLAPAKTKQNEIGVKWENKKVLQTLSLFEIKQANNAIENVAAGQRLTRNGEQRNKGVEYMVSGAISPKWELVGGLMYLNAKQEKTTAGRFDGKSVNGAAPWSGTLAAIYKPQRDLSMLARLNYMSSAKLFTSSGASYKELDVPAHLTLDLGATWKTKWEQVPVTLSLMCYNVTDKKYWQPRTGQSSLIVGGPRTFMFSAGFEL